MLTLAALIVGVIFYQGSLDLLRSESLSHLKYQTEIKSINLTRYFEEVSHDISYLSGTPPIQGIIRADTQGGIDPVDNSTSKLWRNRLAVIFTEMIRAKRFYHQLRYIGIGDSGLELVRVQRHGNEIKVISGDALQRLTDVDYFNTAARLKPGQVFYSGISLNREFGEIYKPHTPVLRVSLPVFNKEKLFGIIVANLDMTSVLRSFILETPGSLQPYLVNEAGWFLAHPDVSKTFGFDLGGNDKITSLFPNIDILNQSDIRKKSQSYTSDNKVLSIVRINYDPSNPERYLGVVLVTDTETMLAGSESLRNQSILVVAGLAILGFLGTMLASARMLRPVKMIAAATKDLAEGRDIKMPEVKSNDEVGELVRSFGYMKEQLEEKEKALLQSQANASHVNKMAALGEMAGGIAHEINNPIQVVSLIAARVKRRASKSQNTVLEEDMTKIMDTVNRIAQIIDSMRNISRDTVGERTKNVTVSEILNDVINMTAERFRKIGIEFIINIPDELKDVVIHCQQIAISQVLINLLNNSYDAVFEQKEKWVQIALRDNRESIEFIVTDCGSGVPANIQERMFEPLFTSKEIGKGTGLGLSLSKSIAEKNRGTLYYNTDSVNTAFVLRLPKQKVVNASGDNVVELLADASK